MATINAKSFKTVLKSWTTSQEKQRDVLQALLVFGFEQFKDHGNTGFLTEAINGVAKVKSIPTNNVKEYIKAHANVALHQAKDGPFAWVFKKSGKEVKVTMPTVSWYDHTANKNTKPTADVDGLALLRTALVKGLKAAKEGKLKAGQAATLEQIKGLVAGLLDPSKEVKPNAVLA